MKIFNDIKISLEHIRFVLKSPRVLPKIIKGIFKTIILKQNVLRVAEIAVNYSCNSRCVMCSCAKLLDGVKEGNLLTPSDYKKIGKELDDLGAIGIVITGGEPMLRKDICEVVKALGPKNKVISLVTNSLLLTKEKIFALKEAGLNALEFSIESPNEEENDKIRGVDGHFKKVIDGINYAKEAGLNICLSPTLGHYNINDFEKFIKFADEYNAFILLSLAGNVGKWSENDNVKLNNEEWKLMEEYQIEYPFIRNDFNTNFSLCSGCPTGREKLYISPYGDIIPCSFTHISFGNIKKESIKNIWKRMGRFYYYRKQKPYCLRIRDEEYVKEVLDPILNYPKLPISIFDHPNYQKNKDKWFNKL